MRWVQKKDETIQLNYTSASQKKTLKNKSDVMHKKKNSMREGTCKDVGYRRKKQYEPI